MQQLTLRVVDSSGQTKTTVPAKTAERTDELLGEMTHGEVALHRGDWRDVDDVLDRRNDRMVVDDPRNGGTFLAARFDAVERGDGTVSVLIEGFELDAVDAEPTAGSVIYQNTADSTIIEYLLGLVPTLEPGTIETLAANLSMSFSHAEPAKALRDVCEATGGELRFNDDRTVDYVGRRGEDKPEIVLSPDEQTVIEEPEITEDERENVTHVRGFGAQSGPNQITAQAVADSYDGGRQIWREYENKDIKEESRLQRIIGNQVEEYDGEPRHIEVDVTTTNLDIDLGDRVIVKIPEENVDRMLRVLKRRSILGAAGALTGLTLSNRFLTRDSGSQEARKDLQRFNRGYEGFVDRAQITSGWNPAGDNTPQELVVVSWPDDIVEEKDVTLAVQGRAWRSPVTPQNHDHSVSISSHSHSVTLTTTNHAHQQLEFTGETDSADGHTHSFEYVDSSGEIYGVEDETTTSSSGGGTTTTTGSSVPLSPEVTTQFDGSQFYPSGVTIAVNGTEVGTVAGDDSSIWTETIDLKGELTSGLNTITATPNTRGEINLNLASELFRQTSTE